MVKKGELRSLVIAVTASIIFFGGTVPAMAQGDSSMKPLGKMTCNEFLQIDDLAKPKYVYFATAYAKGRKPESAVLDIDYVDKLVPVVVEDCNSNLNAAYYARVKAQYAKAMKKAK